MTQSCPTFTATDTVCCVVKGLPTSESCVLMTPIAVVRERNVGVCRVTVVPKDWGALRLKASQSSWHKGEVGCVYYSIYVWYLHAAQ